MKYDIGGDRERFLTTEEKREKEEEEEKMKTKWWIGLSIAICILSIDSILMFDWKLASFNIVNMLGFVGALWLMYP